MRCDAGIYWQGQEGRGWGWGMGIGRAYVFAADQTPHPHIKGLLRKQCIRQFVQIINNCRLFLDPQACSTTLAYHQPQNAPLFRQTPSSHLPLAEERHRL